MGIKSKDIVLKPLKYGNQSKAIRSNADIVCFTGNTGGGKSYALYYAPIQYLSSSDNAKIVCFMRNISDFWGAGKVADTLKKMYPLVDRSVKKQPRDPIGEILHSPTDMGMRLYNGSEIKFQQLDNENPIVIEKISKGLQAKKLIFDECNKFLWRTITAFMPRLRSDANGKAQIYLAQNPERNCFMRKLCGKGPHGGGWINDDGSVDKEMDGVVMYFNMQEGDVDRTYFGKTKREVYEKCKDHIDSLLMHSPDMTYEDFILSMVFFTFDVSDNTEMLAKNKRYRGLAANSSTALSSHEGNWNYSIDDEVSIDEEAIKTQMTKADVERMFIPIEKPRNSVMVKNFITVDMATTGTDNLVMKYWELWSGYGYECSDIKYSMQNSPFEGVRLIVDFCQKHGVDERNLILDTQGFQFLADCFPKARAFSGAGHPSNRGKTRYVSMKDESAHLMMDMAKAGLLHYTQAVGDSRYSHQKMKRIGSTTVREHMKFESVIFQFKSTPNGRMRVLEKEEQKRLIKGMSPDLTDNAIMLCGATCYDCYRMLADDSGFTKRKIEESELFQRLDISNNIGDNPFVKKKRIHHCEKILNILSEI